MELGNNYTKNKKMQYNTCFFSRKFISKDMKAINYKIKIWIGSSILPKEALATCIYPEYVLRLQKERQCDKNQKFIYFFFVKDPCRSQ